MAEGVFSKEALPRCVLSVPTILGCFRSQILLREYPHDFGNIPGQRATAAMANACVSASPHGRTQPLRRRPDHARHDRPFVLDGPINRNAFETYVERVLVPELRKGDIVAVGNPSSHKRTMTRQRIEAMGASLLYLPPYSPDFNPIENASAKLKALLRKAAERTVDGLRTAISRLLDLFTPAECRNDFAAAGYDAT
jgi:transposase